MMKLCVWCPCIQKVEFRCSKHARGDGRDTYHPQGSLYRHNPNQRCCCGPPGRCNCFPSARLRYGAAPVGAQMEGQRGQPHLANMGQRVYCSDASGCKFDELLCQLSGQEHARWRLLWRLLGSKRVPYGQDVAPVRRWVECFSSMAVGACRQLFFLRLVVTLFPKFKLDQNACA